MPHPSGFPVWRPHIGPGPLGRSFGMSLRILSRGHRTFGLLCCRICAKSNYTFPESFVFLGFRREGTTTAPIQSMMEYACAN